jgi:hypothetical protein
MFIFEISVYSGSIGGVADKALKIAQQFPEDSFSLKFNDVSIPISPTSDTVDTIVDYYRAALGLTEKG